MRADLEATGTPNAGMTDAKDIDSQPHLLADRPSVCCWGNTRRLQHMQVIPTWSRLLCSGFE